ncbi:Magnesium and cobalt efflux protein CorC [hydrothermal vent metagenome]|uniref:Magnesium and cobalt efflux protein CorC n=1 Tax=hydrothermal vent metagenome TaxID=652676 RepID=A0A3B0TQU6_9ZZZZ
MNNSYLSRAKNGHGTNVSSAPAELENKSGLWTRIKNLLPQNNPTLREDLYLALQQSDIGKSTFSAGERVMLANVLKLADMQVKDVAVPRADIDAADQDETLGQVVEKFRSSGHSRLPVFAENLDDIVGMVHIKDALQHLTAPVEKPNGSPIKMLNASLKLKLGDCKDMIRKLLFVPPSMPVSDLLQSMQATRLHMAIVVDEYGGTDGLVTIEDLLEAVVGDIEDEHDDEDVALVFKEGENVYCADARADLEELREIIGPEFDPGELAQEADTLGGLVFSLIDRVPARGEVITQLKGFEFEILEADPRRVRRVRIVKRPRGLKVRLRHRGAPAPSATTELDNKSQQQPEPDIGK